MAVKRTGGGGSTTGYKAGGRANIMRAKEAAKKSGRHGGGGQIPKNWYTGGGDRVQVLYQKFNEKANN